MTKSISSRLPDPGEPMLSKHQENFLLELYAKSKWMDREEFVSRKSFVMELMKHGLVLVRRGSLRVDDESFIVGISGLGVDYIEKRLHPVMHFESVDGLTGEMTIPGIKPPPQRWHLPIFSAPSMRGLNPLEDDNPNLRTRLYELQRSKNNHHWYKEVV